MVQRQIVTTTPLSHWTLRKRSTDLLDRDELGVARAMATSFPRRLSSRPFFCLERDPMPERDEWLRECCALFVADDAA